MKYFIDFNTTDYSTNHKDIGTLVINPEKNIIKNLSVML